MLQDDAPIKTAPQAAVPQQSCEAPRSVGAARRWQSAVLFGNEQEIEIQHGQAIYRLRQTSLGKLILTK